MLEAQVFCFPLSIRKLAIYGWALSKSRQFFRQVGDAGERLVAQDGGAFNYVFQFAEIAPAGLCGQIFMFCCDAVQIKDSKMGTFDSSLSPKILGAEPHLQQNKILLT
jgi:hypothetical protein